MSSTFGIYALVCTVILLVYMAVQITRDIFGKNGKKAESEDEVFDNSDITGFSQEVNEGGERGYQISEGNHADADSRYQPHGTDGNPSGENENQHQNITDPEPPAPAEQQTQEQSQQQTDPQQEEDQQTLLRNVEDVVNKKMNTLLPTYQDMYGSTTMAMIMNKPMEDITRIRRELLSV